MEKYAIMTNCDRCTGCLRCELACSAAWRRQFNPSAACITIRMNRDKASIDFTEGCRHCGICADNCFFGALVKKEEETA